MKYSQAMMVATCVLAAAMTFKLSNYVSYSQVFLAASCGLDSMCEYDDVPEKMLHVLPSRCPDGQRGYNRLMKWTAQVGDAMNHTSSGRRARITTNYAYSTSRRTFLQSAASLPESTWQEPPRKPLIIAGIGRSGTTLLQRLLSRNPRSLFLRVPDMLMQNQIPESMTTRRREIQGEPESMLTAFSNTALKLVMGIDNDSVKKWHEIRDDMPEEEFIVLQHAGLNTMDSFSMDLHGNKLSNETLLAETQLRRVYAPSSSTCEVKEAYDYLAAFLMMSQSHPKLRGENSGTDHWVLKAPAHSLALDEAAASLGPESHMIFLHRGPEKLIPSLAHLLFSLQGNRLHVHKNHFLHAAERAMANTVKGFLDFENRRTEQHDQLEQGVTHVRFEKLVENPLAVVESIYRNANVQYSSEDLEPMQSFLDRDQIRRSQGAAKTVKYSAKDFGWEPSVDGDDYYQDLCVRYPIWKQYEQFLAKL